MNDQIKCSERLPDTERYVLAYDHHYFGEDTWHPVRWKNNKWEVFGFEEDDFEEEGGNITHWMEIDLDLQNAIEAKDDSMPNDDRYVLIYSESYFGKGLWHPAAWLGEDDEPYGEFCWAIMGKACTKDEVKATLWMEMPPKPSE